MVCKWFVAAALTLTALPALANDSAITGVGGSLTLLKGEHKTIRMVREKVAMILGPKDYEVNVDFVFTNDGPATSVKMGFPESGSGDVRQLKKSQMLAFHTWVDGIKTAANWVPVKRNEEDQYEAHWVKDVKFGKGQTHKIRVSYRSAYGGSATNGLRTFVGYHFTGANWKGKVDESALTVTLRRPGSFVTAGQIRPAGGETGAVKFSQSGPTLSKSWTNWEAQADFTLVLGTAPSTWRTTVPFAGMDEPSETPIPGSFVPKAAKTYTLGAQSGDTQVYDWCPPVYQRDGQFLVSLRGLEGLIGGKWEVSPENPATTATVKYGSHVWKFAVGSKTATVDGKATALKIAPLARTEAIGESPIYYVPLDAITRTLGLRYEAPKDARTLSIVQ